jgi:replicative DNA helicase
MVSVDGLHLPMTPETTRPQSEQQDLPFHEMIRDLKLLARELNIPILAVVNLPSPVGLAVSKMPYLSSIPESESIEEHTDLVMFIHRDEISHPESLRKGIADIIVAKNRHGPAGTFCLRLDPETMRFHDPLDAPTVPLHFDENGHEAEEKEE